MMKDSLIIIRARDRHFTRLIITLDRSIRFIRVRLTITRARDRVHDRLTTLGPVMAAVSVAVSAVDTAEVTAEVTDTRRRLPKWGQSSSLFFCFKNDNIMTNIGNDCDSHSRLVRITIACSFWGGVFFGEYK